MRASNRILAILLVPILIILFLSHYALKSNKHLTTEKVVKQYDDTQVEITIQTVGKEKEYNSSPKEEEYNSSAKDKERNSSHKDKENISNPWREMICFKKTNSTVSPAVQSTEDTATPEAKQRQDAFVDIYSTRKWGSGESLSGAGSYISYTRNVRQLIQYALENTKVRSFLDAPCGDFHWQPLIPGLQKIMYTGVDIVPSLILRHQRDYLGDLGKRFAHMDLVKDKLPETGTFDMVMTRDAVQHLPLADGIRVYKQIEQSGAKYLITNFFPYRGQNRNIVAGDYYQINVMVEPFNFPPPLVYILDGEPEHPEVHDGKYMGVWKLPVLGKGTGQSMSSIDPRSATEIIGNF